MPPKEKVVTRGYNVEYLKYGFTTNPQDVCLPLCILCQKSFSNEAMKPSRMKEHLKRVHPDKENADIAFFTKLLSTFKDRPTITSLFKSQASTSQAGLQASYEISALIAKAGKPHSIAENLIRSSIEVVMKTMLKKDPHEVLANLPLSNNSVSRRIDEMAADVEEQLVNTLRHVNFALQVDESVVRDNEAILLAYVRFLQEDEMKEEFLFARTLTTNTTAESIYDEVMGFLSEKQIPVENISACASDGAPAMIGRHKGFLSRLQKRVPGLFRVHCILHREHLAAKQLSGALHDALQLVIHAVNAIKANAKMDRLFLQLCVEEDEEFVRLLLHTEIRWLSKGKCLIRFVQLYDTVCLFLAGKTQFQELTSPHMKHRIIYLAEIFEKLNHLNKDMQGTGVTLINCKRNVLAFLAKLDLWRGQLGTRTFNHFPLLSQQSAEVSDGDLLIFTLHLSQLKDDLNTRFQDLCSLEIPMWVSLPFDTEPSSVDMDLQEELIDLKSDADAKALLSLRGYQTMWITMRRKYPMLWKRVELLFLAFPTTWLVEAGFSAVTNLLTKKRNRLDICNSGDLRLYLTKLSPDIPRLAAKHQPQGSH